MSAPSDNHDHPDIPPPVVEQVGHGVYAYVQLDGSWGLNNCGFLTGGGGVTVIDTCFTERRTRALIDAIGAISPDPLRTLVNTHHHGDHTHGNYLLPAATIVGHERCRDEVLASGHIASAFFQGVEWGELAVAPPFVTFDDRLNVYADERKVELQFMGPAHTTNDIVAWLPDSRILFAGDLVFNGGTPFVVMGSVAGSLAALERLRALQPDVIVPGHGAVCTASAIDAQVNYLQFVQEVARRGFDAGTPPLDLALATDLGDFAALLDPERIVGNLYRAYSELRGEPLGAPADPQAFADMVTYNDGQPLRCLA
ncbi:MAG TPA: MBL fold metallo-hydrolase [Acidimicrobiales bacterium]|nr:MBL fold metallo-hydrolase [Acidimicrobiales bacterium]